MELTELLHPKLFQEKAVAKIANVIDVHFGNTLRRSCGLLNGHVGIVRAFWWTGTRNFGDLITPYLLNHHGITPFLRDSRHATLAATGSILGMLPKDFSEYVFGSGLLSDTRKVQLPQAKIRALRGSLTRERINAPSDVVLGDPGLLVADCLPRREKKRFQLGIVPHYEDKYDPRIRSLASRYRGEVLVINCQGSPTRVIRDIDQCSHIVSSSLHGVVIADTLGIPNTWSILSDRVYGKGFKFRDYYSAFGIARDPIVLKGEERLEEILYRTNAPPPALPSVRTNLSEAWRTMCQELLTKSDL